jgi:ADP-ribose pyrophosphatase
MSAGEPWRVLGETELLRAPRLRVTTERVALPDGRIVDDYLQMHMGRAAVIAAQDEAGRYMLFRMYKHGPRRAGLGFPGGGVEDGETPLQAAQRELREETGLEAGEWLDLGGYAVHSNQGCGFVTFFAARGARAVTAPVADDLESHESVWLTRAEMQQALKDRAFLSMGHVCMAALALALA